MVELRKENVGDRDQILVFRQVVRSQGHSASKFACEGMRDCLRRKCCPSNLRCGYSPFLGAGVAVAVCAGAVSALNAAE